MGCCALALVLESCRGQAPIVRVFVVRWARFTLRLLHFIDGSTFDELKAVGGGMWAVELAM